MSEAGIMTEKTTIGAIPFRITDPELIPAERYYDPHFFELEK
jgi:carnitine monooxygenase subunit